MLVSIIFINFALDMNKNISTRFETIVASYVASNALLKPTDKVLVALSGGADSVALLLVLRALGYDCHAAHCNFHLRGDESMRDEQFVATLCQSHHINYYVKDFDVPAYCKENGVSVEMACRDLRYAWFKALCREYAYAAIAVAHHRDDNIETFFLNALRGTGIAGLTGIHPKNGAVVRPLLCVSKAQILDYLAAQDQDFVTDSTNAQCEVKRNVLRNKVLPQIYDEFPQAAETINNTIGYTLEGHELLQELIAREKSKFCTESGGVMKIDILSLLGFVNSRALLFEILKPYGFNYAQSSEILTNLEKGNSSGKHFYSSTFTLTISRDKLEVFVNKGKLEDAYAINLTDNKISDPVSITIQKMVDTQFIPSCCDGKRVIALNSAVLNCERVEIRHWHDGDRFCPFGMHNQSKLVSDLFTDLKLSERKKNEAWILEADGEILWILGYRAAENYRVKPADCDYLLLSLDK